MSSKNDTKVWSVTTGRQTTNILYMIVDREHFWNVKGLSLLIISILGSMLEWLNAPSSGAKGCCKTKTETLRWLTQQNLERTKLQMR